MIRSFGIFLLLASASLADVTALSSYAKGLFAERAGKREEARQHFEATLAADPHSFTVAQRTAIYQSTGEASKTLRKFAQTHPDHLPAQLHYADFLQDVAPNDTAAEQTAIATLEAARERFPNTPTIFSRLIRIHESNDDRDSSLALFREELNHDEPQLGGQRWVRLIQLTRTLIPGDDPDYETILADLHARARRDGIADPSIARRVSDYHRQGGNIEEAISTLADHIHEVPDSLELRTRLGLLLLSSNQEAAGVSMLESTLAIDPDHATTHRSLGQYYERQGHIEKSLHHHASVLRAHGGDPYKFIAIANLYLDNEEPHQARLLLERARFDHPEHAAILARLAIATLRDGETKEAAQLFRQAESLAQESDDPDMKQFLAQYFDMDFQTEFAHSLRDAGDFKAAESRLREAIRSAPEDQQVKTAQALRELARLWLDQNKNRTPAASLLRRADSLDPGNEETVELLERTKK